MNLAPEQIWDALKRVEQSQLFGSKPRLRQFLRYVVTETVEGRAERIKSYSIGLEVFGRTNPDETVVRTNAGRLRQALSDYYREAGLHDPVRIVIPKGSYVPNFLLHQDIIFGSKGTFENVTSAEDTPSNSDRERFLYKASYYLILLVLFGGIAAIFYYSWERYKGQFSAHEYFIITRGSLSGNSNEHSPVASNFDYLITKKLVNLGTSKVVELGNNLTVEQVSEDINKTHQSPLVVVLSYDLSTQNAEVVLRWKLTDASSQVVYWADVVRSTQLDGVSMETLAETVAVRIAGPAGVISRLMSQVEFVADGRYSCLTKTQRIAILSDDTFRGEMIECLSKIAEEDPDQPVAWGLLAVAYSYAGEANASLGRPSQPWFEKARMAASKANELSPEIFFSLQAKLFSEFHSGQMSDFLRDAK